MLFPILKKDHNSRMKSTVKQLLSEENVPLHSIQDNSEEDSTDIKLIDYSTTEKTLLTNDQVFCKQTSLRLVFS